MADKSKKNVFQKIGQVFKEVRQELKKSVWPSKEKLKATSAVVLAVILFFAGLLFCGFLALYLDSNKGERHLGWRLSLIIVAFLCLYCEYSAVNIGFTIHPPKKANMECKG